MGDVAFGGKPAFIPTTGVTMKNGPGAGAGGYAVTRLLESSIQSSDSSENMSGSSSSTPRNFKSLRSGTGLNP